MATIEIDRPYMIFDDEGALKVYDEYGKEMKAESSDLVAMISDGKIGTSVEIDNIVVLRAKGVCCEWVWVPGVGPVCVRRC